LSNLPISSKRESKGRFIIKKKIPLCHYL